TSTRPRRCKGVDQPRLSQACSLRPCPLRHDLSSTMSVDCCVPPEATLTFACYRIDPSIRLRRAIHAGDALLVKRILKSHPSLLHNPDHSLAGLSNSNLHLAASLGHRDICETLLLAGHEDPCPALNDNHQTALMLAAAAGHTDVVHLLCENNRDSILRRDIRGRDAIMEASMGGWDTPLQLLLTYVPGGPYEAVQRADTEGNTALHFASSNGNLLGLRTLLAAGADVERRNIWNWTPAAYSATVQAEVYLKGLVSEVERRHQLQKEVESTKKGGVVRVVPDNSDDDE
ncbi:Spherulin-1A, partial [Tolypocladium paradoxum]